jgi:hypothetical protein
MAPDNEFIAAGRPVTEGHTITFTAFNLYNHHTFPGRSGSEVETPSGDVSYVLDIRQITSRAQFLEHAPYKVFARSLRAGACNTCQRSDGRREQEIVLFFRQIVLLEGIAER